MEKDIIEISRSLFTPVYVDGCSFCEREKAAGNKYFPSHEIKRNCNQPNPQPHCTCDACW